MDKVPSLILLSDTHLGATGSKFKLFSEFLDDLIDKLEHDKNYAENLKCLIILGDIFDLVCDSYQDIAKDYKDIYDKLEIISNKGIHIFMTLGNHDISVLGDFDKNFKKKKKKLIKNFRKKGLKKEYLQLSNLAQYIVIKKENNNCKIILYDTSKFDDKSKVNAIIINLEKGVNKDFYMVLAHGHQFYPEKTHLAAPIWDFCLNSPDFIREIFNFIWNELIRGDDYTDDEKFEEELENKSVEISKKFNIKMKEKTKNKILELQKNVKESELKRKNILEEEMKIEHLFDPSGVTEIIFGHTHKIDIFKWNDINVYNLGAWHHVNPSYGEFYRDGTIKLKIRDSSGTWKEYNK